MRNQRSVAALAILVVFCTGNLLASAAEQDGVALAIVYDSSGSMKDPVRDATGGTSPKYVVANRALTAISRQIEAFVEGGQNRRVVNAALFSFQGEEPRLEIPMAPFDARSYQNWASTFKTPAGNTPLGNALAAASRCVLESPLAHKHVLVITDGLNTAGPPPSATLPGIRRRAAEKGTSLGVHFVAFDVNAKLFEPLKKQGVTVVGAANEKELNSQLQFILARKILLEDEEPVQKSSPSPGGERGRENQSGTNK